MDNKGIMQGMQQGIQSAQPKPQPQQAPIAPQATPQPPAQAPGGGQGSQPYDSSIAQGIEEHLNKLPDEQKGYLVNFLTPELAVLFGIILGREGYDYFAKYADPRKQLVVVPRQQTQPQQASPVQNPATSQPAQAQPTANAPQKPPARSIMGV